MPPKFNIPFGADAGSGFIRPIPEASQIGINEGYASLTDGFPPLNATPKDAGGIPPFIQDMNGIINQITEWLRWSAAGGGAVYDPAYQAAIGGYPLGAIVRSATSASVFWLSTVNNNLTNPDSGGAGWRSSPLAAATNAEVTTGTSTRVAVTPASLAAANMIKQSDFTGANQSFNTAGYQRLPGGLIIQWGRMTLGDGVYATVTWPIRFPNACLHVGGGCATEVGNTNAQANGPLPYAANAINSSWYQASVGTPSGWWIALGH